MMDCSFDPTPICGIAMNRLFFPLVRAFFGSTSGVVESMARNGRIIYLSGMLALIFIVALLVLIGRRMTKPGR